MRGVLKGESSNVLAVELNLNYNTVLSLRHEIQENAEHLQPNVPLPDFEAESDELFKMRGKKGVEHFDLLDPPRCRANKLRGAARLPMIVRLCWEPLDAPAGKFACVW